MNIDILNEQIAKETTQIKESKKKLKDYETTRRKLIEEKLGVNIKKVINEYHKIFDTLDTNKVGKANLIYFCDRFEVKVYQIHGIYATYVIKDFELEKCMPNETILQIYELSRLPAPTMKKYDD